MAKDIAVELFGCYQVCGMDVGDTSLNGHILRAHTIGT